MHDVAGTAAWATCAGVLVLDPDGRVVHADDVAEGLLGRPLTQLKGQVLQHAVTVIAGDGSALDEASIPYMVARVRARPARGMPLGIRTGTGENRWLVCDAIPVLDAHGTVVQVVTLLSGSGQSDGVTSPAVHHQLRGVLDNVGLMTVCLDPLGLVQYVNPCFLQATGLKSEEVVGQPWFRRFVRDGDVDAAEAAFREVLRSGGHGQLKTVIRTGRGDERTIAWSTVVLRHGATGVTGVLCVGQDLTARERAEDALQHQALHDALTGLPNRVLLQDRLEQAILGSYREGRGLAVLFLDVDRFRDVNEAWGPSVGDELLREIGGRIKGALRASDTVARLGGDEFAVLLPKAGDEESASLAIRKIQRAMEAPLTLADSPVHLRLSIGAVLCPKHGETVEVLLRRGDSARYAAKHSDSGFAFYAERRDDAGPSRLALIAELRNAIERNELQMYYQPALNLKTGKVDRVEALVRWQHPERGLIPPDQFISLAEQTGLIQALSEWVLKAVLRQHSHWTSHGLNLGVAVNFSMRNLHDPRLPEKIAEFLETVGVDPTALTVEITESTIMADPERAMDVLSRIRAMGVEVAIDDFGTGYSSLAYLKQLPVTEIKIDKSFIIDMAESDNDAFIVRSTMNLGHDLGLKVVAEGVESQRILDLLADLGCDAMQGYHLSRPIPPDEFIHWLSESSASLALNPELETPETRSA